MDKEKIQTEISNLSDEDKEVCLSYLIAEELWGDYPENIEINIENNHLNIVSRNEKIQWDWLIDNSMLELLKINPEYNFKYQKPA